MSDDTEGKIYTDQNGLRFFIVDGQRDYIDKPKKTPQARRTDRYISPFTVNVLMIMAGLVVILVAFDLSFAHYIQPSIVQLMQSTCVPK